MIIYIFNSYFPDETGFGIRCKKEIDSLSDVEDVTILCRRKDAEEPAFYPGKKNIPINRFGFNVPLIEKPKSYKSGLYEIYRNIFLLIHVALSLIGLIRKLKKDESEKKLKLFAVSSPLTVPLTAYFIGKIFGAKPEVIEFHDLEPELAMHIKKISPQNIVVKIELFLEKMLCRLFEAVVVTTQTQAERISKRCQISPQKVIVIPNTVEAVDKKLDIRSLKTELNLADSDFLVAYTSVFTYEYTYSELLNILSQVSRYAERMPDLKFIIIGDGEALADVKKRVAELEITDKVRFTGQTKLSDAILSLCNAGIVPWERNDMTETMLPTKLFSYMVNALPVIAPNYGEFSRVIQNRINGILYESIDHFYESLIYLYQNRDQTAAMGGKAYNTFQNYYTVNIISSKIKKLVHA